MYVCICVCIYIYIYIYIYTDTHTHTHTVVLPKLYLIFVVADCYFDWFFTHPNFTAAPNQTDF